MWQIMTALRESGKAQTHSSQKQKAGIMFIRQRLVNTQVAKNKNGRRLLMKTLGIFELHALVDKTYNEFCNGKTTDTIFQENAIAKKHKTDYEILLLNKFLKEFDGNVDHANPTLIKKLTKFASLSKIDQSLDLGFVYFIKIDNKLKIGRTTNLLKRMCSYKSHNGSNPKILKLKFLVQHSKFEYDIINNLKNVGLTKEWFDEELQEKITLLF